MLFDVGESIKLWSKVIVKLNISNIIRYEFLKVPVHFDCLIIFFRREHWSLFSTFTCWQQLLDITKKESKDHGLLGDICSNQLAPRLCNIIDNSRRIFNRVSSKEVSFLLSPRDSGEGYSNSGHPSVCPSITLSCLCDGRTHHT